MKNSKLDLSKLLPYTRRRIEQHFQSHGRTIDAKTNTADLNTLNPLHRSLPRRLYEESTRTLPGVAYSRGLIHSRTQENQGEGFGDFVVRVVASSVVQAYTVATASASSCLSGLSQLSLREGVERLKSQASDLAAAFYSHKEVELVSSPYSDDYAHMFNKTPD